jgi:RNA polymerase sigma-70 factor (ECF subfamily)
MPMPGQNQPGDFEQELLPHLDSAYNLALWLTRDRQDAQDVVQEAYARAWRFYGGYRGGQGRAWLLRIVRNTCYTWLEQNRPQFPTVEFDESLFGMDIRALNPEQALLARDRDKQLRQALEELPEDFREVLTLRELEEMSYKEISEVTGMALGTVMSRLARARSRLRESLTALTQCDTSLCAPHAAI